jgi:trans-2,3-dihydro-3-hydroxyanthranilate isomerase
MREAMGVGAAYRYVLMDVFTDVPLEGNQLAVFPEAARLSARDMQRLAFELKLSESVFVVAEDDRPARARVRIFTPTTELPFAGHPVLGTAVVLGIERGLGELTLETGAGPVAVSLGPVDGGREARVGSGRMHQPIPTWRPYERAGELLEALDVKRSELPVEAYVNGPTHTYVVLEDREAVAALDPDMPALSALGQLGVSCVAGAGGEWRSRVFAPGLGVDEDPATGSAAGPLAVHLARYGRTAFGQEIEIVQGVELGRPSLLLARAVGAQEHVERVEVGGSAVILARGEFLLG